MEMLENRFGEIASLFGNRPRAIMLWCLLDGKAYTATELALSADISFQSASNHLLKLVKGNLLKVENQGRHRYYTFANPEVARVVESMASLIPDHRHLERKKIRVPETLAYARTCYDHLAGSLGVKITKALLDQGILLKNNSKAYILSNKGRSWFKEIEIDTDKLKRHKRSFAHPCLDWSERTHHLAGALGAAILDVCLRNDWIRRKRDSREIIITSQGKTAFRTLLQIEL